MLGRSPPIMRGIQLICTSEMPDKIRTVFPYEVLNAVQSKCYPTAFQSDTNLVVSAPTGSGKTAVMELAICRVVMNCQNTDFKIVYQAPTKALCNERYHDWERKFKMLGLECAELTGDTEWDHLRKVQQARIIITTPEKWDSITRKWKDNMKLVHMIKLFLVDEVHMLKDQRGATLEAVISRMKSIGTSVRFVAISATIPNSEDIATWLGRDAATPDMPAAREVFDESFRPVQLEKHVYGYHSSGNDFAFESVLRKHVPNAILTHGKRKPTMVFCMTRKSSAATAKSLATFWETTASRQPPWPAPAKPIIVSNAELRTLVHTGVAFHHGGLSSDDRTSVEQGFLHGNISVICSTSTLAVGVNLPCYLVVLQGTVAWGAGGVQPYSDLEVMQMLGRAGRPQYETSASAVILTRDYQVARYQDLVSGNDVLESTLHRNLIEHLNAEIALGTINDKESAKRWLAGTFLKVRVARNPKHYPLDNTTKAVNADILLEKLCEKDIELLLQADMIENDARLKCTPLGDAMARSLVCFDTMKTFTAMPPRARTANVLASLVQAAEFSDIRIRSGEKSFYKELNRRSEITFPVKVDIALPAHKVSIIIQAELGGASLPDGENYGRHYQPHGTDRSIIFQHAKRLVRCIVDCQLYLKDAISVRSALELGRSLAARAWDNTPRQLKQLPDVGDVSCRKLAKHGINSIDRLLNSEPYRIEMALGRLQPFGNKLLNKLATYPQLRVSIKEMGRGMKPGEGVNLNLKCQVGFLNEKVPVTFNKVPVFVCFLVEDSNGRVIDFRRFSAAKLGNSEDAFLTVHLEAPAEHIRCSIMCDEIVGTSRYAELAVKDVPVNAFPITTSLGPNKEKRDSSGGFRHVNSKDCFADEGLCDQDLLAIPNPDGIEIVEDIDDLLLAAERDSVQASAAKTARKSSVKIDNGEQSQWKERTQLPNGRWTCQHLCKEKGIECKHRCCHEGVSHPRKKPTKVSKADDSDTKQPKITSMAGGVNKTSKGSTYRRRLDDTGEPKRVVEDYGEDDGTAIDLRGYKTKPLVKKSSDKKPSPESDFGREAREDQVDIDRSPYLADEQRQRLLSQDDIIDIEDAAPDAEDCDWNPDFRSIPDDDLNEENDEAETIDIILKVPPRPNSHVKPPNSHVSMREVQKKPDQHFVLGADNSSPVKVSSPTPGCELPLITMDDLEALFADETSVEMDEGPSPVSPQPPTPESNTAGFLPASATERRVEAPDGPVKSASHPAIIDTKEQETKRSWHEDQMRRWNALPPWMFEQFGQFVDLVDRVDCDERAENVA